MPDIYGTAGNDTLTGTDDADVINGYDGDDTINGGFGADVMNGGSGDDTFVFTGIRYSGNISAVGRIDGGSGNDTLDFRGVSPVTFSTYYYDGNSSSYTTLNFSLGSQRYTVANVERIFTGDYNDTINLSGLNYGLSVVAGGGSDSITGTSYGDYIYGESGNDTIYTGGGIDNLYGGDGEDFLGVAADGNQSAGAGSHFYGEGGNDTISFYGSYYYFFSGSYQPYQPALIIVDGGAGSDTFVLNGLYSPTTIDLARGIGTVTAYIYNGPSEPTTFATFQTLEIRSIENVTLQSGTIIGNEQANRLTLTGGGTIRAGGGDDIVVGSSSADTLNGEAGNDTVVGGDGDDLIDGGDGIDTVSFEGWVPSTESLPPIAVTVDLAAGTARSSVSGSDALVSIENVRGSNFVDLLSGNDGSNRLEGLAGNDTLNGFGGDDFLVGGAGNDVINGGAGQDTALFATSRAAATVSFENGVILVSSNEGIDRLAGVEALQFLDGTFDVRSDGRLASQARMTLTGTAGADTLTGGDSNDTFVASAGNDALNGGDGTDTLVLAGAPGAYYFEATATGYRIHDGLTDIDTIEGIEQVQFAGGPVQSLAAAVADSFDPYRYMASYSDLASSFSGNPTGAYTHYIANGQAEGRSATAFDTLRYIASNPDLIKAFGLDVRTASEHYVRSGIAEHRAIASFDPLSYLASNVDLIQAFGSDLNQATAHYISAGSIEHRPLNSFDALTYIASNADLARVLGSDAHAGLLHFVDYGFAEHRATTGFDALRYIASNLDLAQSFGVDAAAGLAHYLNNGADEGRSVASFDPRLYAASSVDLARFIGGDTVAAETHYIQNGIGEGRVTSGFDSVAYLLTSHDLAGMTADQALGHWLSNGADEGRIGDAAFGREQSGHLLTGSVTTDAIGAAGDQDWFQVSLAAGQQTTVSVNALGLGVGTLTDAVLTIYDSVGRQVAFDNDSGPGADATLTFTSSAAGSYYVVVGGQGASSGTYQVNVGNSGGSMSVEPAEGAIEILGANEAESRVSLESYLIDDALLDTGAIVGAKLFFGDAVGSSGRAFELPSDYSAKFTQSIFDSSIAHDPIDLFGNGQQPAFTAHTDYWMN